MHVDPSLARRPQLYPHRDPVRLDAITESLQRLQAGGQVPGVDGQVEVPVIPGLASGQRGHSPAARHPVPDFGTVHRGQDLDHLAHAHVIKRTTRRRAGRIARQGRPIRTSWSVPCACSLGDRDLIPSELSSAGPRDLEGGLLSQRGTDDSLDFRQVLDQEAGGRLAVEEVVLGPGVEDLTRVAVAPVDAPRARQVV